MTKDDKVIFPLDPWLATRRCLRRYCEAVRWNLRVIRLRAFPATVKSRKQNVKTCERIMNDNEQVLMTPERPQGPASIQWYMGQCQKPEKSADFRKRCSRHPGLASHGKCHSAASDTKQWKSNGKTLCLKKHNTNTLDIFGHNSTDTGVEGWYSPLPRDMTWYDCHPVAHSTQDTVIKGKMVCKHWSATKRT